MMTLREGLELLKSLYPLEHCFISHECAYYGSTKSTEEYYKAYVEKVWSNNCPSVEAAVKNVITKKVDLKYE